MLMKMVRINENEKKKKIVLNSIEKIVKSISKVNNRERIHLTDLKFYPHTVYNNEQIQ